VRLLGAPLAILPQPEPLLVRRALHLILGYRLELAPLLRPAPMEQVPLEHLQLVPVLLRVLLLAVPPVPPPLAAVQLLQPLVALPLGQALPPIRLVLQQALGLLPVGPQVLHPRGLRGHPLGLPQLELLPLRLMVLLLGSVQLKLMVPLPELLRLELLAPQLELLPRVRTVPPLELLPPGLRAPQLVPILLVQPALQQVPIRLEQQVLQADLVQILGAPPAAPQRIPPGLAAHQLGLTPLPKLAQELSAN
jgi:hypothetical protein